MTSNKPYRISVRQLVEICLKTGDLGGGYVSRTRALDGIREHVRLQAERGEGYQKEVAVTLRIKRSDFDLDIYGRIDGVFEKDSSIIVEEIKTCIGPAEEKAQKPSRAHLAQLKCYGHMLVLQKELNALSLQLTYVQLSTQKEASFKIETSNDELSDFFTGLVDQYCEILQSQINWRIIRNQSIDSLPFPYDNFRENQRQLAEAVYKIIKNEKILFARAPTGTGKTIATLFPAVKALGLGHVDKIFYLTAKTIGRTVALKALDDMRIKGLNLKSVVLTAKQKICFISDEYCDMETCPYALGYYDKLSKAMPSIQSCDSFTREEIEAMGIKYELCPFELSLDISLSCDVIICDLNYGFDPRVYLKRFFDQSRDKYTFLIDEAHNLNDRLRSMYSADLLKSEILSTQRLVRDQFPDLSTALLKIHKRFNDIKQECKQRGQSFVTESLIPEQLLSDVRTFIRLADVWLDHHREENEIRSSLLECYFRCNVFITIASYFDDNYQFYGQIIEETDLMVKLYCMDPSPIFSDLINRGKSSVLFSATLTPLEFHHEMLFGNKKQPYSIHLSSPFPIENLGVFLYTDVQTQYLKRADNYRKIAQLICKIVASNKGNYMIFFPSYSFMNEVFEHINKEILDTDILIQSPYMTESQRKEFIEQFSCTNPLTGFVIMGGIFGEGIDLIGDQLIGAVIIGPGIPQICLERDLIRKYYDQKDQSGFFKSYQMPGFNRVMQAAGRVIRTQQDKGIVVLMDERFSRSDYQCLFPEEWEQFKEIHQQDHLLNHLKSFWENQSH